MTSIKNCTIIYGYTDNCLDDIDQDSPVLLIEPRNEFIDKIRSLRNCNVLLISKVLTHKKSFQETTLYYKKENDIYWLRDDTLTVNGFNMFNIRKYVTYTITLEDIISQYKLQNIKAFIVNLNITNITQILDSLSRYNHIVSNIYIKNEIQEECKIVVYYNKQQVQGTETGTETGIETGAYFKYVHKNLNVEVEEFQDLNPTAENICVVTYQKLRKHLPNNLDLKITLYETPRNFVTYSEKL